MAGIDFSSAAGRLPIQPAWEHVDIGGKVRKLNLVDNKDGTWTHSKSGDIYHHQSKFHSDGSKVLEFKGTSSSSSTTTTTTPSTHNPKNVLFRIGESGKVEYLANTPVARAANVGKYHEMAPDEFAIFKGGGKRTASNKMTDPVSLKNYAYDEGAKQFHEWDKTKAGGFGKKLSTTAPSGGKSENKQLFDRIGDLVDRRRKDRTTEGLKPFDVGPYKKDVALPNTIGKLSGVGAWTVKGGDVNRDHIVSGESLNRRGDPNAYDEGITVAIPNPEMHQPFSPTYGGRQQKTDTDVDSKKRKRVDIDADFPHAAAHRDFKFMLEKTRDQDYSSSHSMLDLTKPVNRIRQVGAYRRVSRLNAKINTKKGAKRGFDPKKPAIDFSFDSTTHNFSYSKVPGKTQGDLISDNFESELRQTKRAKRI